ncbi:DEKNAAC101299 [Brettanomyces naardenensis]|uniref:DEKNAAC101299 n=1 Tax=Brettanomyces naardenensis TaxID=13370 RepID=A0A448YHW1_BRENA|nr:DEKNAAC101299 [Brettanomyces naardenensis]
MDTSKFELPAIYNFPPFFTRQPNLQTYETQLDHWRKLILDYCKFYKIWALSLNGLPLATGDSITNGDGDGDEGDADDDDADDDDEDFEISKNSLFQNNKINRSLKNDFVLEIYKKMIDNGESGWINDKNHKLGVLIYWHSLEEWANIIMDWIVNTGQEGAVLTLYELRKGELSESQEFSGMNLQLLLNVMDVLSKEGRVRILKDEDGSVAGVKFGG